MGKLMKYEWKKQRTSRMIVMVALAVCVLAFLGGMLPGRLKNDSKKQIIKQI